MEAAKLFGFPITPGVSFYSIFAEALAEQLPEAVKKMNKRLETAEKKSGQSLGRVTFKEVGPLPPYKKLRNPEAVEQGCKPVYTEYPLVRVAFWTPELKLGPWTVKGVMEEEAGVLMVHGNPPLNLRSKVGMCEHCQTKRSRRMTFAIENRETGEQKVVGKTCLEEFMGMGLGLGAIELGGYFNLMSMMRAFGGEEFESFFGERRPTVFTLSEFFGITAAVIAKNGYKKSEEGMTSTKEMVLGILTAGKEENRKKAMEYAGIKSYEELAELIGQAKVGALIEEAEFRLAKLTAPTNYEENLLSIIRAGRVPARFAGYAVSIPGFVERARERELKAELTSQTKWANIPSQFVGQVGKREVFEVIVTKRFTYETQYGTGVRLLFESGSNKLGWWASSGANQTDFKVGNKLKIKATVKKFETSEKWGNITELSRVALVEVVEAAKEVA